MKIIRAISLTLTVLLTMVILPSKQTVKAETIKYMRVLQDNAVMYSDVNLSEPLFEVPKTYYVKIEANAGNSYKVSYGNEDLGCPKIFGYMKFDDLTATNLEPTNPYSIIKVSTDTSDILFNDVELKNPYFNLPKNEILYYYGDVSSGDKVLCYVYYSKKLGYVDKTCLNPFSITPNPDPIDIENEQITQTPNPDTQTDNPNLNLGENLQLIIIIGISVVSISVVYFLFKPAKNKIGDEQNEVYTD